VSLLRRFALSASRAYDELSLLIAVCHDRPAVRRAKIEIDAIG